MEYYSFFSPDRLEVFWGDVKWILFLVAPAVLIWMAAVADEHLVVMIRSSILGNGKDKDDDDDYDIYHY